MKRTDDQLAAIHTFDRNICVDAGAGSGKTSVIVERIATLLAEKRAKLDEIVAITFTEKAASEMKARLRKECRIRAPKDDSQEMTRWRTYERQMDSARISTFHAFCMALLKQHALELGIDPDFAPIAGGEEHLLRTEAVEDTVHRLLAEGFEPAMQLAVDYGANRFMDVCSELVRHSGVMDRFAEQKNDRDHLLKSWQANIEAFNDFMLQQLRHCPDLPAFLRELHELGHACADPDDKCNILRLELIRTVSLLTEGRDMEWAVADIQSFNAKSGSKAKWTSEDAFKRVRKIMAEVKAVVKGHAPIVFDPDAERRTAVKVLQCLEVYRHIEKELTARKASRVVLQFDDLMELAVDLLRKNDAVRKQMAAGIKFLLVDEFQDTDPLQDELIRLLMGEKIRPTLMVVGDAKQSIYYFRGADVSVFSAMQSFSDETIPLDVNFRSQPLPLAFVNDFFERSGRLATADYAYRALKPFRDAQKNACIEFLFPENVEDKAKDARKEEAELIAARIAQLCMGDAAYGDVAVLFRAFTNVHLYEAALRRAGIPFRVVSGRGFYERQEIADLRNLLSVAIDPYNETALFAVLRSPICGLSDDDVVELVQHGRLTEAFYDETLLPELGEPGVLEDARSLMADLRDRSHMPLTEFLHFVLERTQYEAVCLSQFLGPQKAANVHKIFELAAAFDPLDRHDVSAFVEYLDRISKEKVPEGEAGVFTPESGAVTLMTIHQAKGLEFPYVFIPDTNSLPRDNNTPAVRFHREWGLSIRVEDEFGVLQDSAMTEAMKRDDKLKQEAEHWRVFYVALTRAKDGLFISGSTSPKLLTSGSWLAALDAVCSVTNRKDGESVSGDGWSAVVRRKAQPTQRSRPGPNGRHDMGRDELQRRIAPAPLSSPRTPAISVTELIDRIYPSGSAADDAPAYSGPAHAALRGTIVHALFERWNLQSNSPPSLDEILAERLLTDNTHAALHAELSPLVDQLPGCGVAKRLQASNVVHREVPFTLKTGRGVVSGVIDAILDDETLVDYKTGAFTPEKHDIYCWQLRFYGAAFREIRGRAPADGILYYVDHDREERVSFEPDALDRTLADAREAIEQIYAL